MARINHDSMHPSNYGKMAFGWACSQAKIWGWAWEFDKQADCYIIETDIGWLTADTIRDFVTLVSKHNSGEYGQAKRQGSKP